MEKPTQREKSVEKYKNLTKKKSMFFKKLGNQKDPNTLENNVFLIDEIASNENLALEIEKSPARGKSIGSIHSNSANIIPLIYSAPSCTDRGINILKLLHK